jgi:hypothetical protein
MQLRKPTLFLWRIELIKLVTNYQVKAPVSEALPVRPAYLADLPIKASVAAGKRFHLVTNKPDRTGPESCQSNRHHTSIYVTNRPQSNCSTNWGLYYWSELWERAGVELWNVSSVLLRLCRTLDGVWGKEKYGWKFGHFKTDRSQTVRTQNWLSLYWANGRTETCRKQLRRPPFSSLHVRFAQWHCKRIEPSVTSRHADWYTITEDLNERRLHTHGQLGSIWSSYKMMKTLRYAETPMTNSPHQCRR